MPKFIVMSPVKCGKKKGEPIAQPGDELELTADEAAPMLAAGTIAKPKDAEKLQAMQSASQSTAALVGRVSELEAAIEGLEARNAELEGQVADLAGKLAAAAEGKAGKDGGGGKKAAEGAGSGDKGSQAGMQV